MAGILDTIGDFVTMKPGDAAKAGAVILAAKTFTGEAPIVETKGDVTFIRFTDSQKRRLRELLDQWHGSKPGNVRIELGGLLGGYYAQRYWYYVAGAVGVGLLAGLALK